MLLVAFRGHFKREAALSEYHKPANPNGGRRSKDLNKVSHQGDTTGKSSNDLRVAEHR